MGLLDILFSNAPDLAGAVGKNPQLLSAALSLLSSNAGSVGGSGGLAGVIDAFQQKGLGGMVDSWVSTGPNPPVSGAQVQDVLGVDVMGQFAAKAGLRPEAASGALASVLPSLIDHLTPHGTVPQANALEGTIGSLLSSLGGQGGLGNVLGKLGGFGS